MQGSGAVMMLSMLVLASTATGGIQELLYEVEGRFAGDGFGVEAARLGDWDGDGTDDLGVGAGRGYVRVLSGRDGSELQTWTGPAGFGLSLASVDLDGDGLAEIAVGAPLAGDEHGRVQIYSGKDGSLVRRIEGDSPKARFGTSLWTAAGVAHDQLVVGTADGALHVLSDLQADPSRLSDDATDAMLSWAVPGSRDGPWTLREVGDVDGDGVPNLAAGVPYAGVEAGVGSVAVLSFVPRARSPGAKVLHTLSSGVAGDSFGWSVADAGDVDADGFDDIIVGAPGDDRGGPDAGAAYVFSGHTGKRLFVLHGETGEKLGSSVGGLGDVDGDGRDDVFVSAQSQSDTRLGYGVVRVYASPWAGRPSRDSYGG